MTSPTSFLRSLSEVPLYQLYLVLLVVLLAISFSAQRLARKQKERRNPDRIGFIDWNVVTFLSFFAAFYAVIGVLMTWGRGA